MPISERWPVLRVSHKLAVSIPLLTLGSPLSRAQSPAPEPQPNVPDVSPASDGKGYILHVTTREIVVEIVARDRHNHPVDDLKQTDFEVFDGAHRSADAERPISGFRTVGPADESSTQESRAGSVVLPLGGRREIRSTVHYEVAFHPARWISGYHFISVTTTRPHIKLSYRAQYYVGVSDFTNLPAPPDAILQASDLLHAACFHSSVPPSFALNAKRVTAGNPSQLAYTVTVLSGSIELAGLNKESHHVGLQYGVCAFSKAGSVLGFWHFSEDRTLNVEDVDDVLASGWSESVAVPRNHKPAFARFVVLEPNSGNLGTIDLSTTPDSPQDQPEETPAQGPLRTLVAAGNVGGANTVRLGSPLPKPGSLCGDIYELPTSITFLPDDFKVLNALGAIYADALNVPETILGQGIPGSTQRSEWFGIDYYGAFWVTKPGKYVFTLDADDGADLYIDDHRLITNDGIRPPQNRQWLSKARSRTAHHSSALLPGAHIRQSHASNQTARSGLESLRCWGFCATSAARG